jgi:hypothetical protein
MLVPFRRVLNEIDIVKLPYRCAFCSGTNTGSQPILIKVEGYAEIFL